jgi:adenine-specific DNA-methyltransferase
MTELDDQVTDEPEPLDLRSNDIVGDKVAQLLELFPEIRTEDGQVDFERLRLALGESVDVGKERYGMTWPGKADCFKTIQAPSLGTLLPAKDESVSWDTTENLIIEGDNLEVLKLLQKSYLGKVKMIYIDPPYNTGNDFIYPDDYAESLKTYLQYTGQADDAGRRFSTNTDTDGRFHSKWLNMMYPRLYLARNLLRDDGVIFISIDDNEVENLRRLCDEIFGEENFLSCLVWMSNPKGREIGDAGPAGTHEYLICFARDARLVGRFRAKATLLRAMMPSIYKSPDYNVKFDDRGPYVTKNELYNTNSKFNEITRPTLVFNIHHNLATGDTRTTDIDDPRTFDGYVRATPHPNARPDALFHAWRWSRRKVESDAQELEFVDSHGELRIFTKVRDVEGMAVKDLIVGPSTTTGQRDLAALGLDRVLDTAKPVDLIGLFASTATITGGDDIVLDFFAGSGTTAQSILELNAQDGGHRKFILVQLPEPTDGGDYPTIADITKERVRRAIGKLNTEDPGGATQDRGFRMFKLAESNIAAWDGRIAHDAGALTKQLELHVDHVRDDRSADDVLFEILLKSGFPLSTRVESIEIEATAVTSVAEGALLICLDQALSLELVRAVAARKPERAVFLDEGFAGNDALKANAAQVFKAAGVTFRTV